MPILLFQLFRAGQNYARRIYPSISITFEPKKQQHAKLSFSLVKVTEQIRIMPKSRITGCHDMSWCLNSLKRLYKKQDEKLPGKRQPLSSSQETKVKMTNQRVFQKCFMRGCKTAIIDRLLKSIRERLSKIRRNGTAMLILCRNVTE